MHDAQELLTWLLDALHEDLNRVRAKPVRDTSVKVCNDQFARGSQERHAAEAWCEHLRRNRSVVVDLFQGQLRSQLRCTECGAASVTFDPFLSLALPLSAEAQAMRLEDAVKLFCREEALAWTIHGSARDAAAAYRL